MEWQNINIIVSVYNMLIISVVTIIMRSHRIYSDKKVEKNTKKILQNEKEAVTLHSQKGNKPEPLCLVV